MLFRYQSHPRNRYLVFRAPDPPPPLVLPARRTRWSPPAVASPDDFQHIFAGNTPTVSAARDGSQIHSNFTREAPDRWAGRNGLPGAGGFHVRRAGTGGSGGPGRLAGRDGRTRSWSRRHNGLGRIRPRRGGGLWLVACGGCRLGRFRCLCRWSRRGFVSCLSYGRWFFGWGCGRWRLLFTGDWLQRQEHASGTHGIALGDVNFGDGTGVATGDFDRRFVGLDFDNILVFLDGVACGDQYL